MKTQLTRHLMAALLSVALTTTLHAQTSAFTYQGQLTENGSPASGFYDLMFSVWNSASGPSQVGPTLASNTVPVSDGLFTVTLDFGAGVFDGSERWLEIGVATNGSGVFTNLSPRQFLASTPYAIQAANAASAAAVAAGNISGTIPLAQLPTTVITNGASDVNIAGTFNGDAGGLTNLDSTQLAGPLSIQPFGLANVAHIDTGGFAYGVAVSGTHACVANGSDGLRVYDISDPANPISVGHTNDVGLAWDVAVSGDYAYLANFIDGLRVYDISNPANVINVGHTNNGGTAQGVAVSGDYAYLANYDDGLRVYDISNPTNVINVGHIDNGSAAYGVALSGHYAYLANDLDGLRVYDIGNPTNVINVGHIDNGGAAKGVAVSDHYAYLANSTDGLRVYDISNPTNVVNVGHIDSGGTARRVAVSGQYAYLANDADGLRVYDISNPANPINVGHIDDGGSAQGVAVSGNYAYLANYDDGLRVYVVAPDAVLTGSVEIDGILSLGNGIRLPASFAPDSSFIGTAGNYICFGHANTSEDFIGYKNNTFYLKDSPGGADTSDPDLVVGGSVTATAFNTSSDRALKENLQPVSPAGMLDKVTSLSIQQWNFKSEAGIRHIGPMAQDFYGAFGFGPDDKHIATVDADGVALAAIQGLNEKVSEQQTELEQKQTEITELKARLEKIEALLSHRLSGGAK